MLFGAVVVMEGFCQPSSIIPWAHCPYNSISSGEGRVIIHDPC